METYTVVSGDSWPIISTKVYGAGDRAALLKTANPAAQGALILGTVLNVPPIFDEPATDVPVSSIDEVSISIEGTLFRHWVSFELEEGIDKIASFEFVAPFEPLNEAFRKMFMPLRYKRVDIHIGGVQEFRGVLLNVVPTDEVGPGRFVTVSGYAACGVLQDCGMPPSAYADAYDEGGGLQWFRNTLEQIVETMGRIWGFTSEFEFESEVLVEQEFSDLGTQFLLVAIEPTQKVWPFWMGLAKQRNLVIGSNATGNPRFTRTTTDDPVQSLEGGISPVRKITMQIRAQGMYSSVTGISQVFEADDGGQYTVANPHMPGVLRPFVFDVPDSASPATAKGTVDAKAARMFGAGIGYELKLAGSHDSKGRLWRANSKIQLLAPEVAIYERTEFLIRSLLRFGNPRKLETTLKVVLPESFNGTMPVAMPWGSP